MLEAILGLVMLFVLICGLVMQTTAYYKAQSLEALTPAMALLHGAKVGLLAGPFTPTEASTYADVTAAGVLPTYTGYAEVAVTTWSAPFRDSDGSIKIDGGDILFQPSAYGTVNVIYGHYIVDGTDTNLLAVVTYDQPISLDSFPDAVSVDVQVGYGE